MKLPLGFGELDFEDWFRGLIASFISGGASALTSGFTVSAMDPKDYNFQTGFSKLMSLMSAMFLVNGVMSMALFLRNKPVPDMKTIKMTTETTTVGAKPIVEVKTVEETHVESVTPKKPDGKP